ncbi:shikimate dehydrogenase [Plantactinospora sp. S1510]|uniref:Shikimate dehydrogenase (NADP(+)) n=1 Tax=Plantactinospora alkalitolerans TaxID=2789879 RepID=A0ABS0H3V6_9ACTN|nr:shikimate dehydrogenase [Plantactinospora alkalitolerans]MBF9133150.1 shikimate dehydrogenase [Plantactinospora alkalitolerans]
MPPCRYGLIGSGIGASLSPVLHETEGRQHGLDLSYRLIDVDVPGTPADLGRLLDDAEADGLAGLNITHPFKQRVVDLLDGLSPQARDIGAVNTVVFRDGQRLGFNTDAYGFAESFRRGLPGAAVDRIVQLGAGGAGAACAYAQLHAGIGHLTVVDPDADRRGLLAEALSVRFETDRIAVATPEELPEVIGSADGLVNASPVGMRAHPGLPLPVELLHPGLWVVDVIYMPVETPLLRAARTRGLRAVGGAAMCVFQAAAAFELLTGRTPDTERMLDHLDRLLTEGGRHLRA